MENKQTVELPGDYLGIRLVSGESENGNRRPSVCDDRWCTSRGTEEADSLMDSQTYREYLKVTKKHGSFL